MAVAVVTGAAQGIGLAVAERLAARGASRIALVDIDLEKLQAAREHLIELGVQYVDIFAADLSDERALDALIAQIEETLPQIDVLVNSAGTTERAAFGDATFAQFDRIFALNAKAPFFLMSRLLPKLGACDGREANIVNIVSMNAYAGIPELAVYSASKGALLNMTKNAANAYREHGVRVNGVNVGWVDSPAEVEQQEVVLAKGAGFMDKTAEERPFGRHFHCQDVARIAELLIYDAGPVTGTVVDQEQWVVGMPT